MMQLPESMSGFITRSVAVGVQGLKDDGLSTPVPLVREYAQSGLDPVSISSHFAQVPDDITKSGVAALKLVAGTSYKLDVGTGLGTVSQGEKPLQERPGFASAITTRRPGGPGIG